MQSNEEQGTLQLENQLLDRDVAMASRLLIIDIDAA